MCGFFGVIDFDGNITDSDHQEIARGAASISYRGPDDDSILIRPGSVWLRNFEFIFKPID